LIGGLVRHLVDRRQARLRRHVSEQELLAQSDRSSGVLMASGYIAGGAIAGILIAFLAGVFDQADAALGNWASEHNPLYKGPYADALALLPFVAIVSLLFRAGTRARS
jgi:hypothetical protein